MFFENYLSKSFARTKWIKTFSLRQNFFNYFLPHYLLFKLSVSQYSTVYIIFLTIRENRKYYSDKPTVLGLLDDIISCSSLLDPLATWGFFTILRAELGCCGTKYRKIPGEDIYSKRQPKNNNFARFFTSIFAQNTLMARQIQFRELFLFRKDFRLRSSKFMCVREVFAEKQFLNSIQIKVK